MGYALRNPLGLVGGPPRLNRLAIAIEAVADNASPADLDLRQVPLLGRYGLCASQPPRPRWRPAAIEQIGNCYRGSSRQRVARRPRSETGTVVGPIWAMRFATPSASLAARRD